MTVPSTPWKQPTRLTLQTLALVVSALGISVSLMYSTASYNQTWAQVLLSTVGIAATALVARHFFPAWSKAITVLLVIGALCVPAYIAGSALMTHGEKFRERVEVQRVLDKAMKPDQVEDLALYLDAPSGPRGGLAPTGEDLERLRAYVATLPADVLKQHRVAQRLLKGLEIRPVEDSYTTRLSDESVEVLCRLYMDLQRRLELVPDTLPLDSRQRARIAARVAGVGLAGWRSEIAREHPAYVEYGPYFSKKALVELFPNRLAPGERVFSVSLGSMPLYRVLMGEVLVQSEPGTPSRQDPFGFADSRRERVREDLKVMRAHGFDFTEEELRDPDLQAYLASLRTP